MSVELAALAAEASGCTRCRLALTRTQVVFGNGPADAEVMFVGEAPGQHEDVEGEPFVGAAGKLLNTLLADVGIPRHEVFVANVIKCRPPGNRDPQPDEIEACSPYLKAQLNLIRPKIVVTLGNFASKLLLGRTVGITRLRGQVYPFRGGRLIPTFHPAALLRGGRVEMMNDAKADFRMLRQNLDEMRAAEPKPEPEQLGLFG